MAVTMHDVARLAGVSIKTVSNVINDYPYIRPETKQRVLDAIEQLEYRPNASARSLRSGRTGVISLIIPELRTAYFAEFADSVMSVAAEHGLSVLIEPYTYTRESELAVLQKQRTSMVDGILYNVLALEEDDIDVIDSIETPLVLLGESIFNGPRDHVAIQNVEGTRAATEYLLSLGKRRILALGAHEGEVIGSAGLRLSGYRQAIEAAGLDFDNDLVVDVGTWHRKDGADAMRQFLARGVDFDAVVAFNDTLALGAVRVMQEAGIHVPDDVAVVGFDDIDETRYSIPTLSTIDPGRDEIARRAVEMLLERIEKGSKADQPAREVEVPFRLIRRESTGG